MQQLILPVGASGSGKSTWSRNRTKNDPTLVRLCPDEFRALYGAGEHDQSVNGLVFKNLAIFTENLLQNGYSVLIDATNYSRRNRKAFIEIARKYNVRVWVYIIETPIEVCKQRNLLRDRNVPESVIDKQFAGFEMVGDDEAFMIMAVDQYGKTVRVIKGPAEVS